jgi:hypothetical protein
MHKTNREAREIVRCKSLRVVLYICACTARALYQKSLCFMFDAEQTHASEPFAGVLKNVFPSCMQNRYENCWKISRAGCIAAAPAGAFSLCAIAPRRLQIKELRREREEELSGAALNVILSPLVS